MLRFSLKNFVESRHVAHIIYGLLQDSKTIYT